MVLKLVGMTAVAALIGVNAQEIEAVDVSTTAEHSTIQVNTDPLTPETVTKEDLSTMANKTIKTADKNGDQVLDQEEFLATAEASSEIEMEILEKTEGSVKMAESDMSASSYLIARFESISGDDGQITSDELETVLEVDFAEADSDQNDVLEGEEVQKFAALLKKGKPAY